MPTDPNPESFLLKVDCYQRSRCVEFIIFNTPAKLWAILPQEPQHIPDDSVPAHYFKRFTAKHAGKVYEFTFYHVRKT